MLDDQQLNEAHEEINQLTTAVGDFDRTTQIYKYHIDAGLVTPNEVRQKIGLDEFAGGDALVNTQNVATN